MRTLVCPLWLLRLISLFRSSAGGVLSSSSLFFLILLLGCGEVTHGGSDSSFEADSEPRLDSGPLEIDDGHLAPDGATDISDVGHEAEGPAEITGADLSWLDVEDSGESWSIFLYMCADNNLERYGMEDLGELMEVPNSDSVQILAQVDRAAGEYSMPVGGLDDWETAKRLRVREGGLEEVLELGEVDMGDPAVLMDFLRWGLDAYPADRYALLLWNHGHGWSGFGSDQSAEDPHLRLDELAQALEVGLSGTGIDRLDLIGFDACLMASCAMLFTLEPFADLILVSEEKEPGSGWDYSQLTQLVKHPDAMAEELGRFLLDGYLDHCKDPASVTLSLLDLKKAGVFREAFEGLLTELEDGIGQFAAGIGAAQARSERFGYHFDPEKSMHLVDLRHLLEMIRDRVPEVAESTDAVLSAFDAIVLAEVHGPARKGAHGLSLYFPLQSDYFDPDYMGLPAMQSWWSVLDSFYDVAVLAFRPRFVDGFLEMLEQQPEEGSCGDGLCELSAGEDPVNCSSDCPAGLGIEDEGLVAPPCDVMAQSVGASPLDGVVLASCADNVLMTCAPGTDGWTPGFEFCAVGHLVCGPPSILGEASPASWLNVDAPQQEAPVCRYPSPTAKMSCQEPGDLVISARLTMGSAANASTLEAGFGFVLPAAGDDVDAPVIRLLRRSPASLDADGENVIADWDQRILIMAQGAYQLPLFSKTVYEGNRAYHVVPLRHRTRAPCPCGAPGDPGYADSDGDDLPDCLDPDLDGDGVPNRHREFFRDLDNCPTVANSGQEDADQDGEGDDCEGIVQEPLCPFEDQAATWEVSTNLVTGEMISETLFVQGSDGWAEATLGPNDRLQAMYPVSTPDMEKSVYRYLELELDPSRAVTFRFGRLTELPVTSSQGEPVLQQDGQPLTLHDQLEETWGGLLPYVELAVGNVAGYGDRVFWAGPFELCLPSAIEWCGAGEMPDCQGDCQPEALLTNHRCDDGTFCGDQPCADEGTGPDFNCLAHGFDRGACAAPGCGPDGEYLRDCDLRCRVLPGPTGIIQEIGDDICDAGDDPLRPNLFCAEYEWDGGDCPCGAGCSGHGTCGPEGCLCDSDWTGPFCGSLESCGDGICLGEGGEGCESCPEDCGACPEPCGDGVCQEGAGETCETCKLDCGVCACGDGLCGSDETSEVCPEDCGPLPSCGDGICIDWSSGAPFPWYAGEHCANCPADCGFCEGPCCLSEDAALTASELLGEMAVWPYGAACERTEVAQCVCQMKPECCHHRWSASCVTVAVGACGLQCSCGDEQQCLQHGICLGPQCACEEGWSGALCHVSEE